MAHTYIFPCTIVIESDFQASALHYLRVKRGDRVTVLGEPEPNWFLAQFDGKKGVFPRYKAVSLEELWKQVEAKDAGAHREIGVRYHTGRGLPKDTSEAFKYFSKAAALGDVRALVNLGLVMTADGSSDVAEGARCYIKAAEQGELDGQFYAALCHHTGQGVTQNFAEAVRLYKIAASRGHPDAMYNYGACLHNGIGVATNKDEARVWFRKAADAGDSHAQHAMGVVCTNASDSDAIYWFCLSAAQSNEKAKKAVEKLLGSGLSKLQ